MSNDFYLPNSSLISGWSNDTIEVMKTYEPSRNLITSISNFVTFVPFVVSSYQYQNDPLGRRTQRIDTTASITTNTFGYNDRSEVIAAVLGIDDYSYNFDNIGNRLSSVISVPSVVTNTYSANQLNQYSDINGTNLTFDADGNMLSNGTWTYSWNGENRLITASNGTTVVSFQYDYMGRRFSKVVQASSLSTTNTFIYDGWNLVQETSGTNITCYVWGLDLSQSLQGAGGVGGLLCVIENGNEYYPSFDANGNITEYVDVNGAVVAHYEYSPFGKIIASSGSKKDDFKFRFSTKYLDAETGLYYYGYRYYSPELGRWPNRDPITDISFFYQYFLVVAMGQPNTDDALINSYIFVHNDSVLNSDFLGLCDTSCNTSQINLGFSKTIHSGFGSLSLSYSAEEKIKTCGIECDECSCGQTVDKQTTHSGGGGGSWSVIIAGYPIEIGFSWSMSGTKIITSNSCTGENDSSGCNSLTFKGEAKACFPPSGGFFPPPVQFCISCSLGIKISDCPGGGGVTGGCELQLCGWSGCVSRPIF